MTTVKDLIDLGLLSQSRSYRSFFENYSSPRVRHGFFVIELHSSRSAYLFAKFHGSAFPCRSHRVSLSTSIKTIIKDLETL